MIEIDEKDLEVTFYKASGPGGQKKNKTESAVRIKHLPTGIIVTAADSRSQYENRDKAMGRLRERLAALHRRRKKRIPTAPGKAAREKRVVEKKHRGAIKRGRGKVEE